jgi:hypothetical protein
MGLSAAANSPAVIVGADIAAGTDLRVGRFTVRPTWRVRERTFNTRVTTTF